MTRKLILYYSRSGTTRAIAAELANKLHADMAPIEDSLARRGVAGYLRSLTETVCGSLPVIEPFNVDPSSYDLVLLGTPVWAGHAASPIRRFLCDMGHSLHHVAFFCTYGGHGFDAAFGDMHELLGKAPIAELAIRHQDVTHHRHERLMHPFLIKIANTVRWARIIAPAERMPIYRAG